MLISVITVCFNSENTIRKTLDSMLAQTYQNYEYIIVDGGSTDSTLNILRDYESLFLGKMHIKSERDNGVYDAMNKGIKRCSGSLIGILNSDDWYESDTLMNIKNAYRGLKYEVIYGMQRILDENRERAIVIYNHQFLEKQMITHPTCFVTRQTYEKFGTFDCINYKASADYEFMLRLYYSNDVIFTPVYKVLSNFALGGISSSNEGVRETAKLKYKNGIISFSTYARTVVRTILYDAFVGH